MLKTSILYFCEKKIILTRCCICLHKNIGHIVEDISKCGFAITALQHFRLSRVQALEFLEVYKNVVPEFSNLVNELCNGMCVAIEICGEDVVERLRALAGERFLQ